MTNNERFVTFLKGIWALVLDVSRNCCIFAALKLNIMCTATISYERNRKEIDLLLSIIKKLGAVVSIEDTDDIEYSPEMIRKVEEGRAAYQRGDYEVLDIDDLWK